MNEKRSFLRTVCALAVPVAMQSMLQSSFSIVDQIMIGQLGTVPISAVGFAGKFYSIFKVLVAAVGTVAGIMISQYLGQHNEAEVRRSLRLNSCLALAAGALLTILGLVLPRPIMGLYTSDSEVRDLAAEYLRIICICAVPSAGAAMLSTWFQCIEKPHLPMLATIASAFLNTVLNYLLIFGTDRIPAMGAIGAGIATALSQLVNVLIMLAMFCLERPNCEVEEDIPINTPFRYRQYLAMLMPILLCEIAWSLGENVYTIIYGHMSTDDAAAMNLINPVQGLVIGALCGLSQAAGVMIGKRLGNRDFDGAYLAGKRLIVYGAIGSVSLSIAVVLLSGLYVQIYQVSPQVQHLTQQVLFSYAIVAPFKVLNMILGGGIIRSGGKTSYVMAIDIIGTWCFGVPLGLVSAFVLHWTIPLVYLSLSLEECVRFVISLVVFHRRGWMQCLQANSGPVLAQEN